MNDLEHFESLVKESPNSARLTIKGGLFLGGTQLAHLPDNLTIIGDALFSRTQLSRLPENLKVTGTLYINATKIKTIPNSLKVYGNLDIRKTDVKNVPASVCLGQIIRTDEEAESATNNLNVDAFKEIYNVAELPGQLDHLIKFQNKYGFENFCQGFGMYVEDKNIFKHWTQSSELMEQLVCIGQANSTGSIYAIWRCNEKLPLDGQPIIAFGDEGGCWIVADNFSDFLRLLTYDSEPTLSHENIYFEKNDEESEHHKKYVSYVKKNFQINKLKTGAEVSELISKAQGKYQKILEQAL
ncbi:MAG: hypothetical protein FWC42_07675 [Proteobacteria bacterium]|nr:hypothetical protein [Pseudomonadota bacterium]